MTQLRVSVKRIAVLLFAFFALLACCVTVLLFVNRPPSDPRVLENFYLHRAAFERLRDMFLEDHQLAAVASWGVETNTTLPHRVESNNEISIQRYGQYAALLRQAGAKGIYRGRANPSAFGILVWAGGWGGDARHIKVCWMDTPADAGLPNDDGPDEGAQVPRRAGLFQRIDGNWYLWRDY